MPDGEPERGDKVYTRYVHRQPDDQFCCLVVHARLLASMPLNATLHWARGMSRRVIKRSSWYLSRKRQWFPLGFTNRAARLATLRARRQVKSAICTGQRRSAYRTKEGETKGKGKGTGHVQLDAKGGYPERHICKNLSAHSSRCQERVTLRHQPRDWPSQIIT